MAKEFARAFYNSKRWKDCRRAYIAKRISIDGGMCETCMKDGPADGLVKYEFDSEGEMVVLPPEK